MSLAVTFTTSFLVSFIAFRMWRRSRGNGRR